MKLSELLSAASEGRTAYVVAGDQPSDYTSLALIADVADLAERDGYIFGLRIDKSKGKDTYGKPLRLIFSGITPLGEAWLKAQEHRK